MILRGKILKCGPSNYTTKGGSEVKQDKALVKDNDATGLLDAVEVSLPSGTNLPVGKCFEFDIEDIYGGGAQRVKFTVHSWKELKAA
jgi:hypothetical protein